MDAVWVVLSFVGVLAIIGGGVLFYLRRKRAGQLRFRASCLHSARCRYRYTITAIRRCTFRLYVAHSMWYIATAIRRSRRSRRSRSKLAVAFRAGRYSVDCTCTDEEEVARQISAAMCGGVVDGSAVRPGHTAIRPLIRPRAIDRIEFMAESSHRHHRDRGRRQTSTNSNCRRARNVRSRR